MASQVERVFYGSNQVPGQQLSREDIKQLRFRIKRDGGTIDNVVFDPLVGQDLYMACLKFFKNYSHGSNPTEVGHYEVGNAGASGSDFDVEINNQEIFLFREDDLVLTDAEFTRLNADLIGWTPVALRSMSSDNVQHQWLYLSRSPDNGIRFICIEDTKARIAVIAPNSPHNIAISDAFDTSLFELKSNKVGYIDPTINQSGNYLGGSAVNDFVEKRTFAISVPYGVTSSNTFTKILEYNELYSSSTSRGALFARLKIQFVDTYLDHRLREVDAYIGYDLYNKKPLVTFGSCYKTVYESDYDLKNLHIVTYDSNTRCHIEVYLEHRELTSMRQWISVEVCENFQIVETSYGTRTSHSNWKIPLTSNHWDMVNGASIQPTAAALPTTGVLKTDSYIIQSGNQVPFTYMPFGTSGHEMAIAKLVGNPSNTRLVFKLYCKQEGWVAIGKVERVNNAFKLSFSAISDSADFEAGVPVPYIYLSNLDGVYFVNLNIDAYHTVLESIAIEIENEKKDWEFFGSIPPDSVGTTVSGTDTYMKADPTAEVIDQGTNVPAPTSSTKVLTKQVDYAGREFWKTEPMSSIIAGRADKVVGSQVGEEWNPIYIASDGTPTACPTVLRRPADISTGKLNWLFNNASYITLSTSENLDARITPANAQIAHLLICQNTAGSSINITANGVVNSIASGEYAVFEWDITSAKWVFAGNVLSKSGTYPGMTVGALVYGNASFKEAVLGCNLLLAEFSTVNAANRQLQMTFLIHFTRADTTNDAYATGILEVSSRNPPSPPYTPTVVARLDMIYSSRANSDMSVNVTLDSDRTVRIYATSSINSLWGGVRLIPLSCRDWGSSDNTLSDVNLYALEGASASSRTGTDIMVSQNQVIKTPAGSGLGSPTAPVYAKADGTLAVSNIRFVNVTSNFQLDALGAGESAWIRIRNAGSSSITITAGTLTRTLSPTQSCDVYGYNGSYVQIS